MKLTHEQKEIVKYDLALNDILKIIAFAGTGKTTTLLEYAKARPDVKFLYVCFNKATQLEAEKKFPFNVKCKTSHSLAWRNFGAQYKNKLVNNIKANTIMDVLNLESYEEAKFTYDTLLKFIVSKDDFIHNHHIPINARQYYDINKSNLPNFVKLANDLWKIMCDENNSSIGMIHDGYLKLFQLSNPKLNFDCILLDEAQDTNPVTASFLLNQKCSKILVGDPYQQIYSWRGAINAMENVISSDTKYLTNSFRFGNNIAELANTLLYSFKNESRKLIGVKGDKDLIDKVYGNYTVISRTNAEIFDTSVSLYKKYKIGFIGGIEGYRFNDIVDTYYLYSKNLSNIRDSYIRSFKTYSKLKEFANAVEDWEIKSRCNIVEKYKNKIPKLVKDITDNSVDVEDAEIILTTAHKSKGMEFNQVKITNDFSKLVENEDLTDVDSEEINLIYVAVTRAKYKLEIPEKIIDFKEFCKSIQ
ncbi:MAG: ATP-dependent helicase [Desulfobacterales bacterium]|nr:ATP-dependent helicase [Desulfobacterales bacterium]